MDKFLLSAVFKLKEPSVKNPDRAIEVKGLTKIFGQLAAVDYVGFQVNGEAADMSKRVAIIALL